MGIFRGFLRSKERFINYRKLPYFESRFWAFFGEAGEARTRIYADGDKYVVKLTDTNGVLSKFQ